MHFKSDSYRMSHHLFESGNPQMMEMMKNVIGNKWMNGMKHMGGMGN